MEQSQRSGRGLILDQMGSQQSDGDLKNLTTPKSAYNIQTKNAKNSASITSTNFAFCMRTLLMPKNQCAKLNVIWKIYIILTRHYSEMEGALPQSFHPPNFFCTPHHH